LQRTYYSGHKINPILGNKTSLEVVMAVDWTEERVETLTQMWLDGSTARQIAEILGEGVTRNAVIGKANRLGLSKPSKSSETRRQRRTEVKQAVLQMPEGGATILTLTSSTCRWPIGDPGDDDFRFCGAKPKEDGPYCEFHARLAYQPPASREARRNRQRRGFGGR
jgi:GcrA cell cycle regulator